MAKFPKVEVSAILAREELNRGRREKGLEFLAKAGDGPIAQELRAAVKRRGRQPFGAKHLWWEIGAVNDEMRSAGIGYEDRRKKLGAKYMLDVTQVATALAKYERAAAEIREIDEENS